MTALPIHVLLVEDDDRLAALTAGYLESHGLAVTRVSDGSAALAAVERAAFDAVILDLMLPGRSGLEICRDLRRRYHVPIIMVTARTEEADRVMGLDSGADDYVSKPFSARELLARVQAHVRRARGAAGPTAGECVIRVGRVVLSAAQRTVTIDGAAVELTSHEFALLQVLAESAGRVLTREQLLERAHGSAEESFDRAIDVQISRIRAKLGDDARRPRLLKTVRGVGYVLVSDDAV